MQPAMKPVHTILAIVVGIVALFVVPLLFPSGDTERRVAPAEGLPWQIERLPGGETRVFGLTLTRSTLDDARERLGKDVEVAMIVSPGGSGSVEAFFQTVAAGFVTGKMVLTLETSLAQREAMLQRARKVKYMESSTRRVDLAAEDQAALALAPIIAIGFIPSANLDEPMILQRFGVPAERIRATEHTEHFLYPEKGLDVVLDAKGKELLQYVAPSEFARLRMPLVAPPAEAEVKN